MGESKIEQYVAVTKTGEIVVLTPVYAKIYSSLLTLSSHNTGGVRFVEYIPTEYGKPLGYVFEYEDKLEAVMFGPDIINDIEVVSDL